MKTARVLSILLVSALSVPAAASAAPPDAIASALAPHKAVYDIDLVATHSGSQILNISGQMTYEWKPSCDAWVTDHRFKLFYEYADAPGMRITSDFSTYESFDGKSFNYSSRRQRDGEMYQEIRGHADAGPKGGKAVYSMPEDMSYDLAAGTLFPIGHTVELIRRAEAGDKFYSAQIFDGSDEEGPIEISSFIGKSAKAEKTSSDKIDADLLKSPAWNVRMAVFPVKDQEEESDYEMSMVFHRNGIISDMLIEYDDFSVKQKLVSLEKVSAHSCGSSSETAPETPKKP